MRKVVQAAIMLLICGAGAFFSGAAGPVRAQIAEAATGAPFPDLESYRVQVYGDTLAEGLQAGLADALSTEPRLQLQRRSRPLQGLLRGEFEDELKAIEAEVGRETPNIAVILLGLNDRVPLRAPNGRRFAVGADEWRGEYGRRLDKLMRLFRGKSVAVYWVGLPIMRRQDIADDAQMMGGVVRERALANGARFLDVLPSFANVDGTFTTYGPDVTGKNRMLRDQDGVHFTAAGYRKLAFFVEREIKRDMGQARAEKPIPLAGDEAEQKRIRPVKASAQPGATARGGTASGRQTAKSVEVSEGDLPPDDARVTIRQTGPRGQEESAVTLEISRPAIPAAVVALVTRRESADKASQLGDPVMTEIGAGVTVISSITPSGEAGQDRRQQSPTNSLYYRVLIKGERLPPKPGRSDDLPWPREEVLPAAPQPVAAPAPVRPATDRVPPGPVTVPQRNNQRRG